MIHLLLLALSAANAQDLPQGAYNAHGFSLVPSDSDTHDLLGVWRAERQQVNSFGFTGIFEYAENPLSYFSDDGSGHETEVLGQLLGLNLGATWSPHERVSLGAALPVWLSVSGEGTSQARALGDVRLYAPIGLVLPDAEAGGFGLSVVPGFTAPSGAEGQYLGVGSPSISALVVSSYSRGRFVGSLNAGLERQPSVQVGNLNGGSFARLAGGLSAELAEGLSLRGELVLNHALTANDEPLTESPAEATLSARYRGEQGLALTLGAAKSLIAGAGAAEYRAFAGVGGTFGKDRDAADAPAALVVQVQDREGRPIGAAQVSMDGDAHQAGDDGLLRWDGLEPKTRPLIAASAPGYRSATSQALALEPGLNYLTVELDPTTGVLRVIAIDEHGDAIDANVRFMEGPADQPLTALGEDGEESFALEPGDWEVLVAAEGFAPKSARASFGPDEVATVTVRFDREDFEINGLVPLVLHDVLFDFDKDTLRAEALPLLQDVASTLRYRDELVLIEVQGHCDTMGSVVYNDDLSQRRAERVQAYLIEQGVASSRLEAQGYGERQLMVHTPDETREQMNRRVVFKVVQDASVVVAD